MSDPGPSWPSCSHYYLHFTQFLERENKLLFSVAFALIKMIMTKIMIKIKMIINNVNDFNNDNNNRIMIIVITQKI